MMKFKIVKRIALLLFAMLLFAPAGNAEIQLKILHGSKIGPYQGKLIDFYSTFYKEPPYRYYASQNGWNNYISSYTQTDASIAVIALKEEKIIGAALGTPLANATEKYRAALEKNLSDLSEVFYLGELAVLKTYQKSGIGKELYLAFEEEVKKGCFSAIYLWQLSSETTEEAGKFWKNRGFMLDSSIHFEELWREAPEQPQLPHNMVLWRKELRQCSKV